MNEHHRTITDFLRDHGASDVRLIPGGKHPKVAFEFRGKRIERAVAASPSDHRATMNAVADLKRFLGEPDVASLPEKRTIDDLTPPPPTVAPPSMGRLGLYRNGNTLRLRFSVPAGEVRDRLTGGIECARLSRDVWRLRSNPKVSNPRPRIEGNFFSVDVGGNVTDGYEPFGLSPAEYRPVDDGVHVRLLVDQLKSLRVSSAVALRDDVRKSVKHRLPGVVTPRAATVDTAAPATVDTVMCATSSNPAASNLRDVLVAIADVERTTAYRLVRLKDNLGWAWQAPLIKLEVC